MDKIKLYDGTILDIADYASLDHIVHQAKTAAKAREAANAFTDNNLRHVEFMHGDEVNGIYDNLGLTEILHSAEEEGAEPTAEENPRIEGKTVYISLYQK